MSSGEMVPEVMTTLLKRSKTGLMAIEGSRHLAAVRQRILAQDTGDDTYVKWKMGLGTVALSVSNGSRINRKPGGHD